MKEKYRARETRLEYFLSAGYLSMLTSNKRISSEMLKLFIPLKHTLELSDM